MALSLTQVQKIIRETYDSKDRRRGVEGTFMWFMEEVGELSAETAEAINRTRAGGGRIVAVGTTSLRTLESAASGDGKILPYEGETDIFITPGYRFKAVDILLTNFHLPRSTLFMLISAFCGLDVMRAAYAEAIREQYRFYSYGDACLLFRPRP